MNEEKATWREIEHTADLGIEVEAGDLASLFRSAGEGLFALIADSEGIEIKEEVTVSASGDGWEELLQAWLSELLAQFNLRGFLGKRCEIRALEPNRVNATVRGESLDLKRHNFHTEIKGVTYHELKVWEEGGRWRARVIFDV